MKKRAYKVIGVMSGTSLDGIDIALLHFQYEQTWEYSIVKAKTAPYPPDWETKLAEAVFYNDSDLQKLNKKYTLYLAEEISRFMQENKVEGLDAICSHGHTIKHEPENNFTLQIGNLPELAKLTGQTVVCDFRMQDVLLGGQGAPLVPIGDKLLFPAYKYCLNLGGFANISIKQQDKIIAFDICPVNTVLNFLSGKLQLPFDKDGKIAASGNLNEELLYSLNSLEFYNQPFPKSLGIEWVNRHIFPLLQRVLDSARTDFAREDISSLLHTYTVHAGIQIAKIFDQNPNSNVLVTGGGAFNTFLINEMKSRTTCEIEIPSSAEVINFKEALIFGFLGVLKLRGENNILSSVTGAKEDHSSGKIYFPEF